MNCKHCGYPVNRGQKRCPSCGKPVGRARRVWRTILIVVLILAVAVVGFLKYRDIKNAVVKRGMDPAEYYRHVETQNYEDLTGLLLKLGGKGTPGVPTLGHSRSGVTFRLGDMAQQLLAGVNTSGISLDWVHALGLSLETNAGDGRFAGELLLSLNDTGIVRLEAGFDPQSGALSLRVPELREEAILTSMEELGLSGEGPGFDALMEALGRLPSGETLRAIGARYLNQALEQIQNVETGSGTLTAGGLERSCTVLTVRLTDAEAAQLLRGLCQTLREDEEVLGIVENVLEPFSQEPGAAKASLLEELDDAIAELDGFAPQGRTYVMEVSVDAAGRIAGRKLICETDEGELILSRAVIVKGGRLGLDLRLELGGESAAFSGGGKLDGLTAASGSFQAAFNDTPMLTLDVSGTLKGVIKGSCELLLRPERALLRAMELSQEAESLAKDLYLRLYLNNTEDPAEVTFALMHDSEAVVTAEIEHRALEAAPVSLPETGLSPEDWASGIKLPSFLGNGSFGTILENLQQAGVPAELIMGMKLLLPSLLK